MGVATREIVTMRQSLVDEMAGGELGDHRLNERRDRMIAVLEQHPDTSFPEVCADDAEVEALYRFLRNPRLSWQRLIEPHFAATHARCVAVNEVLVIHDTTDMVFLGERARTGLAPLGKGRQGFWLHAALAVSADGLRAPLGLVSLLPYIRKTQPHGTRKDDHARFQDPDKESRYWGDGVAAVRRRLVPGPSVIHVMDRAADSYELFTTWQTHGDRFVVRLNHDRRVVTRDGPSRLRDEAPPDEIRGERQVRLSPRAVGDRSPKARQQHAPREGRMATLQFAARALTLLRPGGRRYAHLPPTLEVNVIFVSEIDPPGGAEPVEWQLITSEPIATQAQVLQVVDWYRARWLIEEFFKALKTGCAYEKRQLESFATLQIALALLAPIAWRLLLLRQLARAAPDARATAVLSPRQLRVLQMTPAGATLKRAPTLHAALRAVARLGGHLKQNGEPGWLVLGRGMQTLLIMEAGWAAAERAKAM